MSQTKVIKFRGKETTVKFVRDAGKDFYGNKLVVVAIVNKGETDDGQEITIQAKEIK